jgi:dipeptidyl aminopeptidase/acylaminoacyl peptidase
LYVYDLESDQLRPVRAPRDINEPIDAWVRQSADGGVLAFTAATATRPSEVYVANSEGADVRRLTDLNADVLGSLDLRAPERWTLRSPEGWEVESWLWLPPGASTGERPLPAILYYHGGPHNTVALGFNDQLQVLAGAGFAVVAVNFRAAPASALPSRIPSCAIGDRANWRMGLPSSRRSRCGEWSIPVVWASAAEATAGS